MTPASADYCDGSIEAVVFDCDGLLVNTAPAWMRAFESAASTLGVVLEASHREALRGTSIRGAAVAISGWSEQPHVAEDLAVLMHDQLHAGLVGEPLVCLPGVMEVLSFLDARCPLAVASNAPLEVLTRVLDGAGISDAFSVVVSADHVAEPKPAPDVYRLACHRLGANPARSTALEDSYVGATAAQRAGMATIVVTTDDWPGTTPLPWPGYARPQMTVTSLLDRAVAAYFRAHGPMPGGAT